MDYKPDHKGTGEYLRFEPALRAELERRAYLGLAVAQSLAPRRTGRLAASGHLEFTEHGGADNDRMEYSLVFDVPYAVPATFERFGPDDDQYLKAAIAVMEAGS